MRQIGRTGDDFAYAFSNWGEGISPWRFNVPTGRGTEPELRPGLRSGHIPESLSLPYDRLFRPDDATLRPADDVRQVFETAGLDVKRAVTATCGSGVSAAVLALGLHLLGRDDVAVYDGSWTEWGGRADTPVEREIVSS